MFLNLAKNQGIEYLKAMEYIRTLSEEEKLFIQQIYDDCKHDLPKNCDEINWFSLYINKKFTKGSDWIHNQSLHLFVCNLVEECCQDITDLFPEKHILNYGFLVNPSHSKKIQPFHCDYSLTPSSLFIPLTKVTLNNATQVINNKLKVAQLDKDISYANTPEEIMDMEGIDAIEISQIVSKPWTVLRLNPGSPHRGIPNSENYDRVMFFVTFDKHYRYLTESVLYVESWDERE